MTAHQLNPAENPTFSDTVPALTTNSVAHPDTWNPVHQILLNNDAALKKEIVTNQEANKVLAQRVNQIEQASAHSVQRAVKLDWLYRNNRVAHELWAPGFTLIDPVDTAIVQGVKGDDSMDVADTSLLKAGQSYLLKDELGTLHIECVAILSNNRIRLKTVLPRAFASGLLTRCSMKRVGAAYAEGEGGDSWLSRLINIGVDEAASGAVIIRRSVNAGQVRLYYKAEKSKSINEVESEEKWTESLWLQSRQGGDIPEGLIDLEFRLPVKGAGYLRVDVEGQAVTLHHIIVLSTLTGLGGSLNPDIRPDTPAIISPSHSAKGVSECPTLAINAYVNPIHTPQAGIQFEISTDKNFKTIVHDSKTLHASLSYALPKAILQANQTYYVRARVVDENQLWSDWSKAISFTTEKTFVYLAAPVIISPMQNAIDVDETPTLETQAFNVIQGEDTHIATHWQIRAAEQDWAVPLWETTNRTHLQSLTLPEKILDQGKKIYFIRARHLGQTKGWSEYSNEVKFTTLKYFANMIGVALTQAGGNGGTWVYVDAEGNTIDKPNAQFFEKHIWGQIRDETIDGQQMVRIPRFYKKHGVIINGTNAGKSAWWIVTKATPGFDLHPAFRDKGKELECFWYGKYQASLQSSKLASIPGVMPAVGRTIVQFKSDAQARNSNGVNGFMLHSIYQLAAIQWLYLIENATMNSQDKTGQGRVTAGSAANVDASDVAQASYRGMVGLWGNVMQFIDGFKTESGCFWVWDKQGNQSWANTGLVPQNATDFYPNSFYTNASSQWDLSDIYLGNYANAGASNNATAPDRQHFHSDNNFFPASGGHYSDSTAAGLWALWDCGQHVLNAYANLGARLAKV